MYVLKRNGKQEAVHFDKITSRVMKLSYGLALKTDDIIEIAKKVKELFKTDLGLEDKALTHEATFL